MTSEAAGLAPPLPWKPRLQMSSLHTLAADLSGLWALANKALDDPRRAGRKLLCLWLSHNGPARQPHLNCDTNHLPTLLWRH